MDEKEITDKTTSVNFDKWSEKLLDAGKGNKLINFKDSKLRTLDILSPDIKTIFDKIKNGSKLSFYDVDTFVENYNNETEYSDEESENEETETKPTLTNSLIIEELSGKLKNTEILAYKKQLTLKKVLDSLIKIAKESLTEKGLNILYIAFGFLKWKDIEDPNFCYSSPLILIPVVIENPSKNDPYYLYQYEEEISTNPTLIYKLKTDFGIDLPIFDESSSDEDLNGYFDKVEKSGENLGWKVIRDVAIGTFSFHKINMYNDLKTNESKILEHENIRRLMNIDTITLDKNNEEINMEEYFKQNKELELHNVVDADSSQTEAIVKAKTGKSMVLQGPPGTGKSQTITNLIAEFLHDGKKILFVSEKLAALNVVFNNLEKVGLSDFCLQLHSNKTSKKEVISELDRTLNLSKTKLTNRVNEEVASLIKNKEQLDNYAAILHTTQEIINRTPYEILGAISKLHKEKDFEYAISNINEKGSDYLESSINTIFNYQESVPVIGEDFRKNCWFGYDKKDTSYEQKICLKKLLNDNVNYLEPMSEIAKQLNEKYQLDIASLNDLYQSIAIFDKLKQLTFFDPNMFDKAKLDSLTLQAIELYELEDNIAEKKDNIAKIFNDDFYSLDISAFYQKFFEDYKNPFRLLMPSYRNDMKLLKTFLANKKVKFNYKIACKTLTNAIDLIDLTTKLELAENNIFKTIKKESFNYSWKVVATDMTALSSVMTKDLLYFQHLSQDEFEDIKDDMLTIVDVFNSLNANKQIVNELQVNFDKVAYSLKEIQIDDLIFKIENCIENFDKLDFWLKFINILDSFKNLKLYNFLISSIDNNIHYTKLDATFKKMFYTQWFLYLISKNESLNTFSRISHDKTVENFKEKDRLKFQISKASIISKLSTLRPNTMLSSNGGQVITLQREAKKSRKQMPVRLLLKTIPELVQTIKPCFLMSPLSVSTYLDDDKLRFDVVIFDEASQIFPWDAVGAIYRAKQVIVSGDSKQMPPSNFFNTGFIEEDDDELSEDDSLDFESILDLCAASFDQRNLKWHYRSRVEELISFSNKNFYENSLVTFPSNQHGENDGVQFYHIENGTFDRKSKTNTKEAEKIIDLIYEHYSITPNRSLGIVAFSISQQAAIENALQKRRATDDRFAKYFDDKLPEPFFVKNLETIQGDERDTILFSVGYAKDKTGKFIHNFGPLNKKGGERRLNVAITRAKYNVKLVASIRSFDIDLNKSQSIGTRLLKEYLDYAENGISALGEQVKTSTAIHTDSEFEIEVHDVLTDAGYKVEMQVGCSDYKIDLVVKHPDKDLYILGIECDGTTYHSAKSTRDRDRLRQEVLERLGWNFYRIWSTEWFRNNSIEKKRLLDAVEKAINKSDNNETKMTDLNLASETKDNKIQKDISDFAIQKEVNETNLKDCFPQYEEADVYKLIEKFATHNQGYYSSNLKFTSFVNEIVKIEQPIMEELLIRRVLPAFGREKVTNVVRAEFTLKMRSNITCKKVNGYYTTNLSEPIKLRLPKDGKTSRDITMICIEEIANGFKEIIKHNIGINKAGLFKTIANLLGYTRLGDNITNKFEEALNYLLKKREVKKTNDLYFINDN